MSVSRWLQWTPKERNIQKTGEPEPPKPTKINFVGFVGATPGVSQIFGAFDSSSSGPGLSQNSEPPSDAGPPVLPEAKLGVNEYTLKTIDWNDPYLKNIGPLRINAADPESATVEGQRIDFRKRSWLDGSRRPHCHGTWSSLKALAVHLPACASKAAG